MKKRERQQQLVEVIRNQDIQSTAALARALNVSKRTITRDIKELEEQGVQLIAHHGKHGGYQIQSQHHEYTLKLNEKQLSALFLILKESEATSALPYKAEIKHILKQCLSLSHTKLRNTLRELDHYIKFETSRAPQLPSLFSDILIYCAERNVMALEYLNEHTIETDNVIFIGLICDDAIWYVVIFEIGSGCTKVIPIDIIQDIAYSFKKTIKTQDINIHNYHEFLSPSENE
ncbi:helix-turn-helix transcriptional regulator [Staphylococcus auricularis]|uniref:helix-turn-helix transcriptional regulator n=1 Tax=Staphylococcus auricularis TaxID=29379 RepID=UPI003EBDA83E